MHKNPELSSMAKILSQELKGQGFELKHTQALELVAKMHGARNLHVHQSELAKETDIRKTSPVLSVVLKDSGLTRGFANTQARGESSPAFQADVGVYGDAITVDLQLPGLTGCALEASDQLSMTVSVENGRPCVYLGNDRNSDSVLQVIGCEGGLYLSPTSSSISIRTGFPQEPSLKAIFEDFRSCGTGYNDSFISNPNA
jgi:hypothetical protein